MGGLNSHVDSMYAFALSAVSLFYAMTATNAIVSPSQSGALADTLQNSDVSTLSEDSGLNSMLNASLFLTILSMKPTASKE